MRFDLHVHTTASDGTLTPDLLVEKALRLGLSALAVTDHDSVDSIAAARNAAAGRDLVIIPGVELSTAHAETDVHILGYFIDPTDPALLATLERFRDARRARAAAIVTALNESGIDLSIDDVVALADDGGAVGRSHIARALVESGRVESVGQAFERLLGRGKPFYRPKPPTAPAIAVDSIVRAGGIAVLAHPGVTGVDDLIPELVDAGLRGIEAYHAEHTLAQCDYYTGLAGRLGLLVTGGTDFHGIPGTGTDLGQVEMSDSVLEDLLAEGRTLGWQG
jgi:hypothetical protein